MDTLQLDYFKAFPTPFELRPEGRNMLIYGENGAGKSSIAEALKLAFHHDRLFRKFARKGVNPSEEEIRFIRTYAHRGKGMECCTSILIDGTSYDKLDLTSRHCAVITRDTILNNRRTAEEMLSYKPDTINFRQITTAANYVFWPENEDTKTIEHLKEVVDEVNRLLETRFFESISIDIENLEMYICLKDKNTGLVASEDLHNYFNEAKINLVTILLILVTIKKEYARHANPGSQMMLVMDDVVTSLDACNRSFLAEYLLDEFAGYQLILLTHNLGFNNTFIKMVELRDIAARWHTVTLYTRRDGPQAYEYNALRRSAEMLKDFDNRTVDKAALAIEARRRFEAVLIEFAKFTLLDARERANFHLKRLQREGTPFFLRMTKGKIIYADDLLSEILNVVKAEGKSAAAKLSIINSKIAALTPSTEMQKAVSIIRRLNMYEKLFVHSVTHGGKPLSLIQDKELRAVIVLLCELEQSVDFLKHEVG